MFQIIWFWDGLGVTVILDGVGKSSLKGFRTICFILIISAYVNGNYNPNKALIHDSGNRSWVLYHLNVICSHIKISHRSLWKYFNLMLSKMMNSYTYSINRLTNQDSLLTWIILKRNYSILQRYPYKYLDHLIKNEFGQKCSFHSNEYWYVGLSPHVIQKYEQRQLIKY